MAKSSTKKTPPPKQGRSPETSRQERIAKMRAEQARKDGVFTKVIWALAIVLAVALIGVVIGAVYYSQNRQEAVRGSVQQYPGQTRNHVEGKVTYPQNPPVGGDHNTVWLNCGVYTAPVPKEHAVHSLEHGAVWIAYDPSLPAQQVDELKKYATQSFMLMSPEEGIGAPIVLTAWGLQMKLDTVDDAKITGFIREYKQGPQTPEPGAACSGGTSVSLVG